MNSLKRAEDVRRQKTVPGFSVQSSRKNAVTSGPPPVVAAAPASARSTEFATAYGRPGFPLATVHVAGQRLRWLVPPELVDYDAYLPVLADGLRERPKPYGACATFGLWELLAADGPGDRVLSALPRTVYPVRRALDVGRRDWPTTVRALKSLQKLSSAGREGLVGPALVPFYRRLLPPVNRLLQLAGSRVTATDGLDVNVAYNLADLCRDTLCVLERTGGQHAYGHIKSVVPTYQSCAAVVGRAAADGIVDVQYEF